MNQSYNYREDLEKCYETVKKGGIILYPTDTVWGIGCDATNPDAVGRVYSLKKRKPSIPMLVLLDSENRLNYYLNEVPDIAWDLLDVADKPLTIVYPGAKRIAENLVAPDGSIGIRISSESFNKDLIKKLGIPLVSTSANITGKKSPSIFPEVEQEIIEGVDYVVKYRQDDLRRKPPSSIIRIGLKGEVEVLRK